MKSRRSLTSADEYAIRDAIDCYLRGAQIPDNAPRETHPKRLAQRRKQIAIGKEHPSYHRYVERIPMDERPVGSIERFPRTPPVELRCSKRGFDSLLRRWRRALHSWDSLTCDFADDLCDDDASDADNDAHAEVSEEENSLGRSASSSRSTDSDADDDDDNKSNDGCVAPAKRRRLTECGQCACEYQKPCTDHATMTDLDIHYE